MIESAAVSLVSSVKSPTSVAPSIIAVLTMGTTGLLLEICWSFSTVAETVLVFTMLVGSLPAVETIELAVVDSCAEDWAELGFEPELELSTVAIGNETVAGEGVVVVPP